MSPAQKFERLPAGPVDVVVPVAAQGGGPVPLKVSAPIDFRQLTRRVPPAFPAVQPPPAKPDPLPVAPEAAFDLIGEVAKALPALMDRCRTLEETLNATRQQARLDLETANEVSREWQRIAQTLKLQVDQSDKDLAAAKARAEAADAERAFILAQADKSRQAAAEAECLASLFKDKVIASFGVGSESHSILEQVRSRTLETITA